MRINRFKLVDIPKNRDYMVRFGSVTTPEAMYSGEETVKAEGRKTDDIELYRQYAEEMNHEETK